MLILARKPGDAIVIAGNIRVVVLESDKRGVRIGIEAPADVTILRGELATAVAAENESAAARPADSEWLQVVPRPASGTGPRKAE